MTTEKLEKETEARIERDIALFKKEYFDNVRIRKIAKEWKYDIGEHNRLALLQMSLFFDTGWKSTDGNSKKHYFELANGYLFNVQHNLNLMNDLNIIDNVTKAKFDMRVHAIEKQLTSLLSSLTKR